MDFELRQYREEDWPEVKSLLQEYWGTRHPMIQKKLFDWQTRGFSESRQMVGTLLAVSKGEVIGFRGLIPGQYQVALGEGEMALLAGASSFMWTLREEFRRKGVGLAMELKIQELIPVMCGMRAKAATSLRIYKKSGFAVLDTLTRYVLPLDRRGYAQLLTQPARDRELDAWCAHVDLGRDPIAPSAPDLDQTAQLWREVTMPLGIFSLHRDREFYKWRYVDSAGFNYRFFRGGGHNGYIVARVERIYAPENPELHDGRVLRLIEIVPGSSDTWQGGCDRHDQSLLRGVLVWARQQGCLAADFYHSTGRLKTLMSKTGFKRQDPFSVQALTSLCLLFQPLKYAITPSNTFLRVNPKGQGLLRVDFRDTCIYKSECDMDRPVLFDYQDWA